MKDEEIYNIFDTAKFLNRPPRVSINQSSGAAGIALWINEDYGLAEEHKVDKHSPVVAYVKKWVEQQYAGGRVSGIGADELHKLIHKFITEDTGNGAL